MNFWILHLLWIYFDDLPAFPPQQMLLAHFLCLFQPNLRRQTLHYLYFQCQNLASWHIQCKRPRYKSGEREIHRRQYSFTWITSKIVNFVQKGVNIKSSNYCTYSEYTIFNITCSSPQRPCETLNEMWLCQIHSFFFIPFLVSHKLSN